ncbi:hydrolase [Comamonas phosphati]|nr:hydrolase [Comamonas phosphati]
MNQPKLNYVSCPGAGAIAPAWSDERRRAETSQLPEGVHRMAYWEWNNTGDAGHPHVIVCVHGLSRQGRDFDTLAAELSRFARVICPDVVGRGESDWLQEPLGYQMPLYAADMLALLAQLHAQAPVRMLDWVGTSMGGLIGMVIAGMGGGRDAGRADFPPPISIRRLVLNDVGPVIEWKALERIGQYLGKNLQFPNLEQAAAALRLISAGFGPHSDEQWLQLTRAMVKPWPEGGVVLHYDPRIAVPMARMTPQMAEAGEAMLWQLYDRIAAKVLLIRGAESDLLSVAAARAMQARGPKAHCTQLEEVGHAPTLLLPGQVALVRKFLQGDERLPDTMSLAQQAEFDT